MRFFKWYQTRRRSGDGQCLPSAEIKRADCAQAFLRSAGSTRKTRGSQPERDNMAAFVTGDLHGGLDIQKLRDWEADEKHVVLYDNIVALGAGSLSRTVLPHQILTANLLEHMRDAVLFKVLPNIAVKEDVWVKQLPLGGE